MTDDQELLPATRGKPEHIPNDEIRAKVMALISFGITHEDIATYLHIGTATLKKYYQRELEIGGTHATAKVASRLFEIATKSRDERTALQAQTFWLGRRAGWDKPATPSDPTDLTPTTITIERKNARIAE